MKAKNKEGSSEVEALYKQFANLLLGDVLSEEGKNALSQELLEIVYRGKDLAK